MAFFEETDDSNRISIPARLLQGDPKLLHLALQAQRVDRQYEAKSDASSKQAASAGPARQGGGTPMAPKSPRADLGGSARDISSERTPSTLPSLFKSI